MKVLTYLLLDEPKEKTP